jgi:predicted Zn-dependent peptidase
MSRRGSAKGLLAIWALTMAVLLLAAASAVSDLPKKLKFDPIEFKIPDAEMLEFDNGLHGYLIEDHDIPVVRILIMYRVGFPAEDKVGLANLAGWAIRNGGSENYTKEIIDEELEFIGASIESHSGSYVGEISTNFLTKDTETVLAIFSDLIINPAFDADQIELRKKSVIEGIRRKADDPRSLGRREFAKLVYKNHPAGWEPTEKSVSNITREDVIEFCDMYMRPDNAVIGISGDITKDEALRRLNALLADWKPGGEKPVFPDMEFEISPSVNYIYKDVNQAYIFAGHMGMNTFNEDRSLAAIMNYVLGGGSFTSWITKRIRSDEGLAYSARSSFRVSPWGYGLFTGSCQTKTDAAMRALTLLIEQIEKMKNEGPSEDEVEDAKESFVNRHVFDYESPGRLVNRLAWFDIVGLPIDTLEREFEAYQSATLDEVKRVAGECLYPDGLTILVVGNQDLFDRPLSDFGKVNVIEIEEEVDVE